MALTKKGKVNKIVAKNRQHAIKLQNAKPVIKKVDVEELKKQFA